MMTSHLSTQNQLRTEVTSHVRRWSMRCNEQPPVILFCTLMPTYDVIAATGRYPQSSRCLGYLISFFWREARSKALTLKRKPTRNESRLVFCRKLPSFCDRGQRQGKGSSLEQSEERRGEKLQLNWWVRTDCRLSKLQGQTFMYIGKSAVLKINFTFYRSSCTIHLLRHNILLPSSLRILSSPLACAAGAR